ncbi:hypothetical protein E2C01_041591 [Portunus trituberculatus]|uniref:Uncharacterized protein n=1 Tax=Portunus trituberculatus TaxID=210409 RepID=A0A5B7FS38_PORTR|nr:hypothetical protein [Portunus trituberculatus]
MKGRRSKTFGLLSELSELLPLFPPLFPPSLACGRGGASCSSHSPPNTPQMWVVKPKYDPISSLSSNTRPWAASKAFFTPLDLEHPWSWRDHPPPLQVPNVTSDDFLWAFMHCQLKNEPRVAPRRDSLTRPAKVLFSTLAAACRRRHHCFFAATVCTGSG